MFGTVWVGGWAVLINLLYCFYLFSRLKLWHELRSGTVHFKEAVSRDFRPLFFHELNPSGPLMIRLNWFFLKIRFHKDIQI